jgi:hypothetical protein
LDYWPRFVARGEENYRVFSKSDLGVLSDVAGKYGTLHWKRLVDMSHEEPAYKRADEQRLKPGGRAPMPYESFFESADIAMLKLAEEEQEHRNLVAAIQ